MNYQIIGGDGKEYGPISAEGVTNWLQEGRANGDTRIKEVGAEEWQCVRDLPEFASAFSTAISPPPAGPVTPSPAAGQFPQQKPGKLQAIAIMTLGAQLGDEIKIQTNGSDAAEALEALSDLVRHDFHGV